MLPRLPECFFAPEDYPVITAETGLNQAQIEQWAWNLRFRLPVAQDREAFIHANGALEQVIITRFDSTQIVFGTPLQFGIGTYFHFHEV